MNFKTSRDNPSFGITRLLSAKAAMDWRSEIKRLMDILYEKVDDFNHVNCATCLFRIAKALPPFQSLPPEHIAEYKNLVVLTGQCAMNLDEQGLANAIWGLARIGFSSGKVLDALSKSAIRTFKRSTNAKAMATVVWGLGELRYESHTFYKAMALRAESLD